MADQRVPVIRAPSLTIDAIMQDELLLSNDFYEAVSLLFVAPPVGAPVSIVVKDSSRYAAGLYLYVAGYGSFLIAGILSPTVISARNVNAPEGYSIPVGTPMTVCDPPVVKDPAEPEDAIFYDTLSEPFVAPAPGATADVWVTGGGWFRLNGYVFIPGVGIYRVNSIDPQKPNQCTLKYDDTPAPLGVVNRTGDAVAAGTPIYPVAPPMFIPDDSTIVASNPDNQPGRAKLSVAPDFLDAHVMHPDLTKPRVQSGSALVSLVSGSDKLQASVTFDTPFAIAPTVVTGLQWVENLGGGSYNLFTYVKDVTAAGFDVYATDNLLAAGKQYRVNWLAIGD